MQERPGKGIGGPKGGQGRGPRVGHGSPGCELGAPQNSKGGPRHGDGGGSGRVVPQQLDFRGSIPMVKKDQKFKNILLDPPFNNILVYCIC